MDILARASALFNLKIIIFIYVIFFETEQVRYTVLNNSIFHGYYVYSQLNLFFTPSMYVLSIIFIPCTIGQPSFKTIQTRPKIIEEAHEVAI